MPVFDTYSWRKKRAEQVDPDVYQYDHVPDELRVQVRHILDAALGAYNHDPYSGSKHNNGFLRELHDLLLRETGRLHLSRERIGPKADILEGVTSSLSSVDEWLDVVEICFFAIDQVVRSWPQDTRKDRGITQDPEDAINELNTRFRRAGFGYQLEAGRIVRVDSQYLHSEVVKPALVLLADPRFKGAWEEFLSAHAHYRAGQHEEAIVGSNRAFESTMKAICDIKGWQYKDGARGDVTSSSSSERMVCSRIISISHSTSSSRL